CGAVNVLIPLVPDANNLSDPSGMTTSASPPFPFQPVATVEVPEVFPAVETRVSKIEVGVAPRFQITCRTPSAVRARPSWTPGCVGPLTRSQAGPCVAVESAVAPAPATPAAQSATTIGKSM